jgi:hypothetical protein
MVKMASRRKTPVDAKTDDTIAFIKEQLAEKEGIPMGCQNLAREETKLEDKQTIEECGLDKGDVIDLLPSVQIYVKMPNGKIVPLDVSANDSIWTVKKKIRRKEGWW